MGFLTDLIGNVGQSGSVPDSWSNTLEQGNMGPWPGSQSGGQAKRGIDWSGVLKGLAGSVSMNMVGPGFTVSAGGQNMANQQLQNEVLKMIKAMNQPKITRAANPVQVTPTTPQAESPFGSLMGGSQGLGLDI